MGAMTGTIWCLHGAVGMAEDWKGFRVPGWSVKRVDLWRFLECCPMSMPGFGRALNEEASATPGRKVLLGYSMGGRLALHALLEKSGIWDAAVVVSAHPGLEEEAARVARRAADAEWAALALKGEWADFLAKWSAQEVLVSGAGGAEMVLADRSKLALRRNAVARSFIDWSLGAQESLWERVRREVSCPLHWMAGEKDAKFRELADRVQALETWIAPGAGHRVPWESADFPRMVGEFLERAVS